MVCIQLLALDRSAWRSVLAPGPADLDQALSALGGSLALAFGAWLLCALLLSLLAALTSGRSAVATATTRAAHLLAPKILRHGIAALLGVAIVASPAVAQAAAPNPGSASMGVKTQALSALSSGLLSPAWAPLDDPVSQRSIVQADARQADLSPGWAPERPPRPARPASSARHLAAVTATPRRAGADSDETVVVRRGDTLWTVAARHLGPDATNAEIAAEWPHWFTANRAVIGNDPDHLRPGERLRAPERDLAGPAADATRTAGPSAGGSVR
jgi:nucleoid-associated protein YgaU